VKKQPVINNDDMAQHKGQRLRKMKVATWKIRGITGKKQELQTELQERKIDIAVITETKKRNKCSEDIGEYIMIYSGVPDNKWAASGVAVLIRKDWKNKIQDYIWISDRIVVTMLSLLNQNFTIVEVYAPIEGKEQETEELYSELHVIDKTPKKENIIIAGDFNGRIGNQPVPECIGQNGEHVINHNGTVLRDFSTFNKLKITNSFYNTKT
jgi:hypothetical protein